MFCKVFIILYENKLIWCCFFLFNDTATTEIYTLSLHDALPISPWLVFSVTSGSPVQIARSAFHAARSEEHTSELQSHSDLVCRLLLEKKKKSWYLTLRAQETTKINYNH